MIFARPPRDIEPEAVGCTQAGPFAEHDDCEVRTEDARDGITERHPRTFRDDERRDAPLVGLEKGEGHVEQRLCAACCRE